MLSFAFKSDYFATHGKPFFMKLARKFSAIPGLIAIGSEHLVLEWRDSELHRKNLDSARRKSLHRIFRYSVVGNEKIDFAGKADNRRTHKAHLA